MSREQKAFGAGAILSPLIIALLLASLGTIGSWASKVPELETTVKLEFGHINTTIDRLTNAQTKTNEVIQENAKSDTKLLKVLSETVLGHDFMIKQILKEQKRIKK